jgi:hypothetical protein
MRLTKTFGLAAVAAMATMAFVGATSASAANTQLCKSHSTLTCGAGEGATTVSMVNSNATTILGSINVTCDTVNGDGTPLALANPQQVHISGLDFESCETSGSDGCEVTVKEQPLTNLNKTGLDQGTLTGTNGRVFVECDTWWQVFDIDIECEYDLAGLTLSVGKQHVTANEAPITEVGSDLLCPNEPTLDMLLKTTASRYVLA